MMIEPRVELREGLSELTRARDYAADIDSDPRDFAVDLSSLAGLGVTGTDVRWLVRKGFAEVVDRSTRQSDVDPGRCPLCASCLADPIRLVLTDTGLMFAQRVLAQSVVAAAPPVDQNGPESPCWDPEQRILRLGHSVVRRYRRPSPNQEAILNAFEEEDWPHRVYDPLPPRGEQVPKVRLHDTIKCLNQRHEQPLIRFFGDGTGEGVCWEKSAPTTLTFPAASARDVRRAA